MSSASTVENGSETETELVRIFAAELSVMGGDRSVVMRTGEFVVLVVTQPLSPLSVAICMVGDHQWPVAKDCPVLRVGLRSFSFALPGFLYGLAFPESCSEEELKRVQGILMRFCAYENHSETEEVTDSNFDTMETKTDFWPSALSKMEFLSRQMLAQIVIEPKSKFSLEKSNDMHSKSQRALRMSATVKLVARLIVKGVIHVNFHVNLKGSEDGEIQAFATMQTFADIMEAVETRGRSIMDAPCGNYKLSSGVKYWNFNKFGLALILRAVLASTHIHAKAHSMGGSRAKIGDPGSDGEQSCVTRSNSIGKP